MKGPSSRSRVDPGLRFSFFLIEKLSITGQKMVATVYERDNSVGTGAVSLCYRNGAEITVFMCEEKPHPE